MDKLYENNTQNRPWKKALSVLLSLIIAFGTLIALTVGSSRLQDWFGIKSMLSAYAAEFVDTKGAIALDKETMLADHTLIDLENKDGSNTVYIFSEPITYTDDNGNLKAKDISVEKQSDKELISNGYEYTNGQNDYRINFSKNQDKGLLVQFDDCTYSIVPKSVIKAEGNEAVAEYLNEIFEVFEYKNIYGNGTNLRFYPQLNGVKDEIVLDQSINQNKFSFELKTENCKPVLNEDGTVSLVSDKDESIVQTFSSPYAYDSEYVEGDVNEHYADCKYTLEEGKDNIYIMTVVVDKEWLDSDSTVYPVVIDPTTSNIGNYRDAGIYSAKANICYGKETTCCFGRASEYGYGRVLNQFTMPDAIKKGAAINSAYIWERETTGRTTTTYVSAFPVKAAWTEGEVTWNTKPSYDSSSSLAKRNINNKSSDDSSCPYWYKFNIASIVKKWADGTKTNYGIIFVSQEETDKNYNWRAFASKQYSTSSYRPYTVINYTNDATAPTVTSVSGNPTSWTKNNVTLTVNGAADNSGGAGLHSKPYSFSATKGSYSWQSSNTKAFSSNQTVYVYVRDALDNIRLVSTENITKIDKTAPTISYVSGAPTEWTKNDYTLSVSASDFESGISQYSFSTIEGVYNWSTSNTKIYTGNGTVYVFAKDNAGNVSAVETVTINKVDKTVPTIEDISEEPLDNNQFKVTVTANDSQSGLHTSSAYSFDSGKTWQNTNYAVVNKGYTVWVRDNVDNIAKNNSTIEAPILYKEDNLIYLISQNNNVSQMQYRIDDGSWEDYDNPVSIPANRIVKVTARDCANPAKTHNSTFINTIGIYEEDATDFTVANNSARFDFSRYYNSEDKKWFYSIDSSVKIIKNDLIYLVTMPDSRILYFVKNNKGAFENSNTKYSLEIMQSSNDAVGYIVKADSLSYSYDKNGKLIYVDDEFANRINIVRNNDSITISYGEGNEIYSYIISIEKDSVKEVKTPLDEIIRYNYNNGKLVNVYYDKDHMAVKRADDTILSEYSYSGDLLIQSLDKSINYNANGQIVEETLANGSYTKYYYNNKTVTATSSLGSKEEKTVTTFNNSLNIAQTVDNDGVVTNYTYDEQYRLINVATVDGEDETTIESYEYDGDKLVSATDGDSSQIYKYDQKGNVIETESDEEKSEYQYDNDGNVLMAKTYSKSIPENNGTDKNTGETEGNSNSEENKVVYTLSSETSYTYANGTLVESVSKLYEENQTTVTTTYYNSGKMVKEIAENASSSTDDAGNKTTTVTTTTSLYTYDAFGNVVASSSVSVTDNEKEQSISSILYSYDALGRCVLSEDKCNNTVTYEYYDSIGNTILEKTDKISNESETTAEYSRHLYDSYGRLIQEISNDYYNVSEDSLKLDKSNNIISAASDTYSTTAGHSYIYNAQTFNLDSEVNELGVKTTYKYNKGVKQTENFDIYEYNYDNYGNIIDIWVSKSKSEKPYAHYEYDSEKRNTSIAYGNGQTVFYEYDSDGNLLAQKYKKTPNADKELQIEYVYIEGKLDHKLDYVSNQYEQYEEKTTSIYTIAYNNGTAVKGEFVSSYTDTTDENNKEITIHTDKNKASSVVSIHAKNKDKFETINGLYSFNYDRNIDKRESVTSSVLTHNSSIDSIVKYDYTYTKDETIDTYTVTTPSYERTFKYEYDKWGNITAYGSVKDGKLNPNDVVYYHYDEKDHTTLVRADENRKENPDNLSTGQTDVFEYDKRGNLTAQKHYSYSTKDELKNNNPYENSEYEYDYENSVWIDSVKSATGSEFVYDENGNPISIDALQFNWTNGRQLSSITYEEDGTEYTLISYTYDDSGIRTSKTFGETTTYYTTVNGNITSQYELDEEKNVVNIIEFLYNNNNELIGFTYDKNTYFYIKNAQGDVTDIVDAEGNVLASYLYYAWGITTTYDKSGTNLGSINPMRYRSYYFDEGIDFYYLQSRYYMPELGRFFNSDLPEIAQERKDEVNALNLFAYCNNNPVNRYDRYGSYAIASSAWYILISVIGSIPVGWIIVAIVVTATLVTAIYFAEEHTKGKRPSTHDKHTKPRPGRGSEKKKQKKSWKRRK